VGQNFAEGNPLTTVGGPLASIQKKSEEKIVSRDIVDVYTS